MFEGCGFYRLRGIEIGIARCCNLASKDGSFTRGTDADLDLIAVDLKDVDFNGIANEEAFSRASADYEHTVCSSAIVVEKSGWRAE